MPLTINGESVDDGLLDAEFSQIKAHFEQQANVSCCERDDEFMGYAKDNLIARVLLAQKAKESIPDPNSKDVDEHLEKLIEEKGGKESFYFKLGIAPGNEEEGMQHESNDDSSESSRMQFSRFSDSVCWIWRYMCKV